MHIDALEKVKFDMASQDYAVFNLRSPNSEFTGNDIEVDLLRFAERLGMGPAFTPDLYAKRSSDQYTTQGLFNHVGGPSLGARHPAFSTASALELHTDGTLQSLGEVRISMLVCVNEAEEGGESIVFRAAAFAENLAIRQDIASFFDENALRRHATVADEPLFEDGPILRDVGGAFFARYCTTPRDEWRYDEVPGLAESRIAFDEALKRNRAHWTHQFLLKRGQVLIMDNARVSHGRTKFKDAEGSPRHIVRALFRQFPTY